jgi:hypothetical protein
MSTTFTYRVKFKDIRVRPSAEDESRARARAGARMCDHDGCNLAGDHPAPRNDRKPGRFFFCEDHAGEYNRNFNFFAGMSEAEIAAFMAAGVYGHARTWRFGQGPMGGRRAAEAHDPNRWRGREFFEGDGSGNTTGPASGARSARGRSELQVRALNELDLTDNATPAEIRLRYADYVRRYHPDSNGGDRSHEHKLARVIRAFKTLKAAGLTK